MSEHKCEFLIIGYSHPDGQVSMLISTTTKGDDPNPIPEYIEYDPVVLHAWHVAEYPPADIAGHHITVSMDGWFRAVGDSYDEIMESIAKRGAEDTGVDFAKLPKSLVTGHPVESTADLTSAKEVFEVNYCDGLTLSRDQWELVRNVLEGEARSAIVGSGRGSGQSTVLKALKRYFSDRALNHPPHSSTVYPLGS